MNPNDNIILYLIGILIGTIIVTLVLYICVRIFESETRAKDKIGMIILIALITVIVLPLIIGVINIVFSTIGNALADVRNMITGPGTGQNYMIYLVVVIGFLILLAINKFLLDISWETALWISLIMLFIMYVMFCFLPELAFFIPPPLTG